MLRVLDKVVDYITSTLDQTITVVFVLAVDGCRLDHLVDDLAAAERHLAYEKELIESEGKAYFSLNPGKKFSVDLKNHLEWAEHHIKDARNIIEEYGKNKCECFPCFWEFPNQIIPSYSQGRKARNLTEQMVQLKDVLSNAFAPEGGTDKRRMYDNITVSQLPSGSRVGLCYGMLGNDLRTQEEVVQHFQWHKINKMRLFWPESNTMKALRGSNIELIIDVPGHRLKNLANSREVANDWVYWNVKVHYPDVRIKYITVGNEVIPKDGSDYILKAMGNVYEALRAINLHDKIKVSTCIGHGVVEYSLMPSAGMFSTTSTEYMAPIVRYLSRIGSPLMCSVFPYFAYKENPQAISIDYALFRAPETFVTDGQLPYQNLFDAMVDAIYTAMEKVGVKDVGIVISSTGWPWKGGYGASPENASSYNSHLINHVGIGTPKRGGPLETYIFAVFNENQKTGPETEKHFGVFYPNMNPVYALDF